MQHLNIKIGAVGDPVLFPEHRPSCDAQLHGIGVLEKGTEDGRCAVAFMIDVNGQKSILQMTARMFLAAAGIVRGTTERFNDPP